MTYLLCLILSICVCGSCVLGQVVFDALGQADIPAVEQLSKLLTEGLLSLQNQENVS